MQVLNVFENRCIIEIVVCNFFHCGSCQLRVSAYKITNAVLDADEGSVAAAAAAAAAAACSIYCALGAAGLASSNSITSPQPPLRFCAVWPPAPPPLVLSLMVINEGRHLSCTCVRGDLADLAQWGCLQGTPQSLGTARAMCTSTGGGRGRRGLLG